MADNKSLAREIYDVKRSLAGEVRRLERQRNVLYGNPQPSYSRKKKSISKSQAPAEGVRLDPGEERAKDQLSIAEEIEGARAGGSAEFGGLRTRLAEAPLGLYSGGGAGVSGLSAADLKRARQQQGM